MTKQALQKAIIKKVVAEVFDPIVRKETSTDNKINYTYVKYELQEQSDGALMMRNVSAIANFRDVDNIYFCESEGKIKFTYKTEKHEVAMEWIYIPTEQINYGE